ncbi:zinc ribbon domain-containing protein [Aquibacillus kalidii]|uniref:zinc ribbon domain-containing protein n=1 Tax=Aquibacillus kalidii TaxID=2762597 RepID=UPI0016449831|nr:zinc-ribbon domain-containing protein [Aquibacillus kalidii]
MKFCTSCGSELKEDAKFCTECGKKVKNTPPQQNHDGPPETSNHNEEIYINSIENQPSYETISSNKNESSPIRPEQETSQSNKRTGNNTGKILTKKRLIAIIIPILVLLGVSTCGYFYAKSITEPLHIVDEFKSAVEEKDVNKLQELFISQDDAEQLNKSDIEKIADFLHDHPENLNQTVDALNEEVEEGESQEHNWLSLKKDGTKYYFFDDYKLEVQPISLRLTANFSGTEIYVNDKFVETYDNEPIMIDQLTPGLYTVRAVYSGEFGDFEKELDIQTLEYEVADISTNIEFDGHYISFKTNNPDSILYINGEEIGKLSKLKEYGPVATNGSMSFQARYDYPWGQVVSKEVSVQDTNVKSIDLNLEAVNEQLENDVMFTINEHVNQYIRAFTNLDSNEFTYMVNEEYIDRIKDNFDSLNADNLRWFGRAVSTEYDLGSIELTDKDSYVVNVLVDITFESAYYEVGEDPSDSTTKESSYIWNYELTFGKEENQWFITNSKEVDSFKTDDREIHNFDASLTSIEMPSDEYDFIINDRTELEKILKIAREEGKLGPFSKSMEQNDLASIVSKFGEPDDMYVAQCSECDDFDMAFYGDYGVDILYNRVAFWLQTDLVRSELEEILGEATRMDHGMYSYAIYEGGNYTLSVLYETMDEKGIVYISD